MKSISNKTKGNHSKSKKARVVILVWDTSSHLVLNFYQVSSKYSKGEIRPKDNMSPHPNVGGRRGGGGVRG